MSNPSLMLELLAPELILVVGASIILLLGLSRTLGHVSMWLGLVYVAGAAFAAYRLAEQYAGANPLIVPALNHSPLVFYVRLVTLAVGALILLVNRHVPEDEERGEFFALILFSLSGISLVSIANNLILLFLALELVSVPTYILIGLSRRDIRAQEATGKYFFLGAFAAAMMLYGFSFLYGAAGTMTMYAAPLSGKASILEVLSAADALRDPLVLIGLLLTLGGLAFKIAAVPLHFYVADVYQGAASPVSGMLGFVPKFAGFVALIQIFALCNWQFGNAVFWLMWTLAAVTMTVGNTLALMQHNVKRMLAYSSVAHSGYMLVALTAGSVGLTAILFYMTVYGVMNLGAFAALSFFRKPGLDDQDESAEMLDDLAGAARRHPWAGLALAICVLGLMGFPLTGGLFGKFYIFSAALSVSGGGGNLSAAHGTGMIVLVVVGVLNAAVGAAYYLRILATCYLRKPAAGMTSSECRALRWSLGLCAMLVLAAFLQPGFLFNVSQKAVSGVTQRTGLLLGKKTQAQEDANQGKISLRPSTD